MASSGQEQRRRLQQGPRDQDVQAPDREQERTPDFEQLQEGQLSAEQASQLQPQLGNAALATMLGRASAGTAVAGLGMEEEQEEALEVGEDEDFAGEELEGPWYGGGGGGGGGGAGGGAPWEVGKLFGGDGDEDGGPGSGPGTRVRPSPWRDLPPDPEDEDDRPEDDDETVAPEDHAAVDLALPALPADADSAPQGDAVHRAVGRGLHRAAEVARPRLEAEDLVDAAGPATPVGRPLALARLLARHGRDPRARILGRTLAGAAATLLVPDQGAAPAVARLSALAVCAQAAEGGGDATDRALGAGLTPWTWTRAVKASARMGRRGRLHAPKIAARIAGDLSDEGPLRTGTAPAPDAIAQAAAVLADLLPAPQQWAVPDLALSAVAPVAEDEHLAAIDDILAEWTGGESILDPPRDPVVDEAAVRPVLAATTHLVNALGRLQVELAAAAAAARASRPDAPVRQVLVHADRALRVIARQVIEAGDALAAMRGRARIGAADAAAPHLAVIRQGAEALGELRSWALDALAERLCGGLQHAGAPGPRGPLSPATLDALGRWEGGQPDAARASLQAQLADAATQPAAARDLALLLGLLHLSQARAAEAEAALSRAWALSGPAAACSWTRLTAGLLLGALQQRRGAWQAAGSTNAATREVARSRHHLLALADTACTDATCRLRTGDAAGAVGSLLAAGHVLRREQARAAVVVVSAHLAELRHEVGAKTFDEVLAAFAAG